MCIRHFVTILASCCLLALCTGGGCEMTSADRIAFLEQGVVTAQEKVAAAEQQIADLQTKLASARRAWDVPDLSGSDRAAVQGRIDQLSAALVKAEQGRELADAVLGETKTALDQAKANPSAGAELDILTSIVMSVTSRLGPQAAAWGTVAAMVLSVLGNIFLKRRLKVTTATAKAIVQGVEASPAEAADAVKGNIKAAMIEAGNFNQANGVVDKLKAS